MFNVSALSSSEFHFNSEKKRSIGFLLSTLSLIFLWEAQEGKDEVWRGRGGHTQWSGAQQQIGWLDWFRDRSWKWPKSFRWDKSRGHTDNLGVGALCGIVVAGLSQTNTFALGDPDRPTNISSSQEPLSIWWPELHKDPQKKPNQSCCCWNENYSNESSLISVPSLKTMSAWCRSSLTWIRKLLLNAGLDSNSWCHLL